MNIFFKSVACVMIAVVLWLTLHKSSKEISVLLTLAVCIAVISAAAGFLQPIINFIHRLRELGNLDDELISVVLKVVGIGLLTEISTVICKDAGNETMGKALQMLSVTVIIRISIPVFEKLLSLLDKILGTV